MTFDFNTWLSVTFLAACVAFVVWKLLGNAGRKAVLAESAYRVYIVDGVIHHQRPDGVLESVKLLSLKAVIIETNDLGPLATDLFWILVGDGDKGCYIPQGATGDAELLGALQTLPGFNSGRLIEAMGSTTCQRFLVWERDGVLKEELLAFGV